MIINDEIFRKYFKVQRLSDMLMFLNKTNYKEKKNELVDLINSGLKDLKEEIKKISKAEIENEDQDPQKILLKRFLSSINKVNKRDKV